MLPQDSLQEQRIPIIEADLDYSFKDDEKLLAEAEHLYHAENALSAATRLLRSVRDRTLLQPSHLQILNLGEMLEKSLRDGLLADDPEQSGWKKQSESHGDWNYLVYYKILDNGSVECRIDSPIDVSLFVPFLAVLSETDLYHTWIPYWKFPFRVGLAQAERLQRQGRANQVVHVTNDFPFPLKKRDVVLATIWDDDSAYQQQVAVKLKALDHEDDPAVVPETEKNCVRLDFDGGYLFRPCPPDHPALRKKSKKEEQYHKHSKDEEKEEPQKLILVSFTMSLDPKLDLIPKKFLNFCTRTVFGTIWKMMLRVAEQVRDGKRPEFDKVMQEKKDLYPWMEQRAMSVAGVVSTQEAKLVDAPHSAKKKDEGCDTPTSTTKRTIVSTLHEDGFESDLPFPPLVEVVKAGPETYDEDEATLASLGSSSGVRTESMPGKVLVH